jgi:hypothetical protein
VPVFVAEKSKMGWLIGFVKHVIRSDCFHLLYLLLRSIPKIMLSFQLTQDLLFGFLSNFDVSRRPCLRLCLCLWSRTTNGLPLSPNLTNALDAMCRLLRISFRSGSHEWTRESGLSSEGCCNDSLYHVAFKRASWFLAQAPLIPSLLVN